LTFFRQTVVVCPDLISSDGQRLIDKATKKVADAFQAGGIAKTLVKRKPEKLGEIGLYD
jgi:hypothetical protein